MEKTILFSGVGDTDPYRGGYDGSLLHIVRHYKPNKVYLYFTKEMYEKKEKKYQACTRSIKAIDSSIEVEISPSPNEMITEAHLPDIYIVQFKKIIKNIIEQNNNSEILLNISSGTPSMKNSLLLLSLFEYGIGKNNIKLKALQVSTPEGKSNTGSKHPEINESTDIEYVVQNELYDILPEAEKRIIEVQYNDIKASFIATQIINMVEKYQYVGAHLLASNHNELFSKEELLLIEHLKHRCTFNIKEADKILKTLNLEEYIIHDQTMKKIVEYFNVIKIKHENQSYHDTLIMISALIELILEKLAEVKLNINFQDVLTNNTVDLDKVQKVIPQYYDVFVKNKNSLLHPIFLKDHHIVEILKRNIDLLSKSNIELLECFDKIKDNRNFLAHEVDIYVFNKIDEQFVKKVLKKINANIKDLYKDKYKEEYENIYNNLNKLLIKKLWI